MRRHQLPICAARLVFVAAWFLPVIAEGVTLPDGLPGWQATRALTTLLFLPGSVWAVWARRRRVCLAFAGLAALAFAVNVHWYVFAGAKRWELRIGYYLWWVSFLLMALGLFDLSRREAVRP
jgi:uncharacterized membrane protein YqaE (UPF0057 family)